MISQPLLTTNPSSVPSVGPDISEELSMPSSASHRLADPTRFAHVVAAIEAIAAGKMVILVDDEDRENEGDLVLAADKVTPEAINFMAKYGRGLVCMPMTGERLDELKISMMVSDNTAPMGTAFTVTVDARRGVTTGTSA